MTERKRIWLTAALAIAVLLAGIPTASGAFCPMAAAAESAPEEQTLVNSDCPTHAAQTAVAPTVAPTIAPTPLEQPMPDDCCDNCGCQRADTAAMIAVLPPAALAVSSAHSLGQSPHPISVNSARLKPPRHLC